MLPNVVELVFVNASTSPVTKSVIVTVAEASVWLSTSVTVAAGDSVTAGASRDRRPPPPREHRRIVRRHDVKRGGLGVLLRVPSFTTHEIVRLVSVPKVVGLSLVEEY